MRRTPLLERDGEVAAVLEAISDVLDGRGRLVVVEGEAGVGKTRLLTHLRDLPESSTFRVFTARGSELERPFAFGIVRQLCEPALAMAADSERRQGRHEAAVTAAMEAGEAWRAYGYRNPALGSWRTEGSLSLLALGRVEEARALAHEELDLAGQWAAPRAVGRALRVLGQVTGGADAIAHLQRSIATLTGSGARLELATSLLELGGAMRALAIGPPLASTSRRPSTWRRSAAPPRWVSGPPPSCAPPDTGRAGTGSPGSTRSPRASCASPRRPRGERPTGRSRSRCSSRPRPSRSTCPARSGSWE